MNIYYISTNGVTHAGSPETPGGIYLDLDKIDLIGDVIKSKDTISFTIYMVGGLSLPVVFSPDVQIADALDMHSHLANQWQTVKGFIPVTVSAGREAVAAQEDPDGSNLKVASVLAVLVSYLTAEGVEKEDKAAWALVDEFAQDLLSPFGESVLAHYYQKRDENLDNL